MQIEWNRNPSWLDRGIERVVRGVALRLGRVFYDVTVVGGENLPRSGGALFVCNHVSYADTIPLSLASERTFRFTSFDGLFEVPVLGRCLRAFGSIPVSATNARETIRSIADCIAAGEAALIFPEGRLTLDGEPQEIKGGYELVARKAGCEIVMVHLDGLWGSIFSFEGGKWFFKWPRPWRRRITVTFAPALSVQDVTMERLRTFWTTAAEAVAPAGISR